MILLGYIFFVFIIVGSILWFIREYKKTKDSILRVLMILIVGASVFPILLFYLDDFNFFTKFGYLSNASSDNWHNFFATYGSTIVSTLFSSVFLVWATGVQIKSSKEDNSDLAKEQLRLQNLPVLKFRIDYENKSKNVSTIFLDSKLSNVRRSCFVNFNIKNIGLGIAQNVRFLAIIDSINTIEINQDNSIAYHNKDEELVYFINFDVPCILDYNKNILLFVYYEDLLGNSYVQRFDCYINSYKLNCSENNIEFSCNVTSIGDYKYISDEYSYRNDKEYLRMKSNEEQDAEQQSVYKAIKDREKLDLKISEYLSDDVDVLKLISDYFVDQFPTMEGGGTSGILKIKDNKYIEVIGMYSMGISSDEFISVTNTLTLDIKTLSFISFKLNVENNTLKISSSKLKTFEKYLEKIDSKRNK